MGKSLAAFVLVTGFSCLAGSGGTSEEADGGDFYERVPSPREWEHLTTATSGLQHHYFDRGTVRDLGDGTNGVWIAMLEFGGSLSREDATLIDPDEQLTYLGILIQADCDSEMIRIVGGYVARRGERDYARSTGEYPDWERSEQGTTNYAWYNAACRTSLIQRPE